MITNPGSEQRFTPADRDKSDSVIQASEKTTRTKEKSEMDLSAESEKIFTIESKDKLDLAKEKDRISREIAELKKSAETATTEDEMDDIYATLLQKVDVLKTVRHALEQQLKKQKDQARLQKEFIKFEKGVRVEITKKNSSHTGVVGEILEKPNDPESIRVHVEGCNHNYSYKELKIVPAEKAGEL